MSETICRIRNEICEEDISCYQKIAGTLTGDEIGAHGIINTGLSNYAGCKAQFQATTYDLRLGDAHYVYDISEDENKWKPVFIGKESKFKEINRYDPKFIRPSGNMGILTIPPFGSALIQLEEIVDTYTIAKDKNILIVGRFDLKLSKVNQALISQQATQVEPCYKGKLFCFLHNLSKEKIELTYLEPIATIEFSYVSCFCNAEKRRQVINDLIKDNKEKRYNDDFCYRGTGIRDIRYMSSKNALPNDCGLASFHRAFREKEEKVDALLTSSQSEIERYFTEFIEKDSTITNVSSRVDKRLNKWLVIISALITIVLAILTFVFSSDTRQLKEAVSSLESSVSALEKENSEKPNVKLDDFNNEKNKQNSRIDELREDIDELIDESKRNGNE